MGLVLDIAISFLLLQLLEDRSFFFLFLLFLFVTLFYLLSILWLGD